MIKAPYNFVPLNEKVVLPAWGSKVSHDLPFEDSMSGSLTFELEALSPLYVRDSVTVKDNNKVSSFSNQDGRYFIPGSSVKGMIRSVLEIMSFGKMKERVDNDRYSFRDLHNNNLYKPTEISNAVLAGWLLIKEEQYFLKVCGKPARITHTEIDQIYNTSLAKFCSDNNNFKQEKNRSAQAKYEFSGIANKSLTKNFSRVDSFGGFEIVEEDIDGKQGTIVFTGQPGGGSNAKKKEFVFWDDTIETIQLDEEVIQNFKFAYLDHMPSNNHTTDWKACKEKLAKGLPVPVFFRKENKKVKDLGLCMMYKITYKNSIHEAIPQDYDEKNTSKYDFAEILFGHVKGKEALKGRLLVSHAFLKSNPLAKTSEVKEILSNPRASYYPNYIEQADQKKSDTRTYKTLMDEKAKIRGWKRYPVHSGSNVSTTLKGDNDKIATSFIPVASGARFLCTLNYFNLTRVELGALLSSLTFHANANCHHSIGMAKPLGYGKIKLHLKESSLNTEELMEEFELYMNMKLGVGAKWHDTPQVRELIAMAIGATTKNDDDDLAYMELGNFVREKANRSILKQFSVDKPQIFKSLIGSTGRNELEITKRLSSREAQFNQAKDLKQIVSSYSESCLVQFKLKADDKINEIRKILLEKKQRLDAEAQQEKIKMAQNNAMQGLDLSNLSNMKNNNVWDYLSSEIPKFGFKFHGLKNEKELLKQFTQGYITKEKDQQTLYAALKDFYSKLNKDDKLKFIDTAGKKYIPKLKQWVGESLAMIWIQNIQKNES